MGRSICENILTEEVCKSDNGKVVTQYGYFYPNKDKYYWIEKVGSIEDYITIVKNRINNIKDCYRVRREIATMKTNENIKNGPTIIMFLESKRDSFQNIKIKVNYNMDILHGDMIIYKEGNIVAYGEYINGKLISYKRIDKTDYLGITILLDGLLKISANDHDILEIYEDGILCKITHEYN